MSTQQPGNSKQMGQLPDIESTYTRIRHNLEVARSQAVRSINLEMARAYWLIGQQIQEPFE